MRLWLTSVICTSVICTVLVAGCAGSGEPTRPPGTQFPDISGPWLDGTPYSQQPDMTTNNRPKDSEPQPPPKQDTGEPPPPPLDSGPPDPCQGKESYFQGYCYLAVGYKWMDYLSASKLCAANQGQVASVLSQAENQFIFSMLPALNSAAWIGLRRKTGQFTWVDGQAKGYMNWASGEPNNENGDEECVVMWGPNLKQTSWHGKWNDTSCTTPGRDTVICKRKP